MVAVDWGAVGHGVVVPSSWLLLCVSVSSEYRAETTGGKRGCAVLFICCRLLDGNERDALVVVLRLCGSWREMWRLCCWRWVPFVHLLLGFDVVGVGVEVRVLLFQALRHG